MRYLVTLSYNGSGYCGWQIQDNAVTVQGELDRALSILFGEPVRTVGAGRTDSGVNAINYVCHFDVRGGDTLFRDKPRLIYKINAITPTGITVHDIVPTADDFHARFSARSREYRYFVHLGQDPFASAFSLYCRFPLDFGAMNAACGHLLGTHDFSCFEKTGGSNLTGICTVTEAHWDRYVPTHVGLTGYPDCGYYVFTVRADRFLRNMVRAMVGSLIEVGRGRRDAAWIKTLLETGTRCDAGESVPGNALFLSKIEY